MQTQLATSPVQHGTLSLYSVEWMTGPGDRIPEFRDQVVSAESPQHAISIVLEFEGQPELQPQPTGKGSLPERASIWFVGTKPDDRGEAVWVQRWRGDERLRIHHDISGTDFGSMTAREWAARGPGLLCPGERSAEDADPADYPLLHA